VIGIIFGGDPDHDVEAGILKGILPYMDKGISPLRHIGQS